MDFLTTIYLFYSFTALYFLILFMLIYFQNKNRFGETWKPEKIYSLGMVVPCYNCEGHIESTIRNLFKSDYSGLKQVVAVDDSSSDNTFNILKKLEKEFKILKVVQTSKNTGCAAGAKNFGSKFIKTELIGFTDDDSYPSPDAMSHMIGYFDDAKTGAVTSRVLAKNKHESLLAFLQAVEYKVIAFTRKLLGFVEAIYVTNGPLSIYRKKIFDEIKGFDEKNWTEDIEITWHFVSKGYKVHMSIPAKIYTIVPIKFKDWFKQRIRWNVGGLQTIRKYFKSVFRCGMLGKFILPYFTFSWILGITGLFILVYRVVRTIIVRYLATKLSIEAQTAIASFNDINLNPNVLLLFGVALLVLSLSFTTLALFYSKEEDFKKRNFIKVLLYMLVYLLVYPAILIASLYNYLKGKQSW